MSELNHVLHMAERNVCRGIIEEPRGYGAAFTIVAPTANYVQPPVGTFFNAEQFPVRLTHMTAIVADSSPDYPHLCRVGLRLDIADHGYSTADIAPLGPIAGQVGTGYSRYSPLTAWANVATGTPVAVDAQYVAWQLERPFLLGPRDTLRVTAAANFPGLGVGFQGCGLRSKRPYFLWGQITASNTGVDFPLDGYRNDSNEFIVVTEMSAAVTSTGFTTVAGSPPSTLLSNAGIQVQQIGHGSQLEWFTTPAGSELNAALLGITSGDCLVHRFPGEGLRLEPGQGFEPQLYSDISQQSYTGTIALGFFGYITIT